MCQLTRDWFKSSDVSAKRDEIRNLLMELHQDSHSSATHMPGTPLPEQAVRLLEPEELLVVDEDDIISSDCKAINSV